MKKFTAIFVTVFFIIGSVFQTSTAVSTNNSAALNAKKLTDCFTKTQKADSVEADQTTKTVTKSASIVINTHAKIENIKKGLKGAITMNMAGTKKELFLSINNGKAIVYSKDLTGKYKANPMTSSQIGDLDVSRPFTAYINIIKSNPTLITKVNNNKLKLNIPKNKIKDFYSKITGKNVSLSFSNMSVEFGIGSNGYLQTLVLNVNYNSLNKTTTTKFYNYNKKFNIVLPKVS
jgi:hypothetical protein